MKKNFGKKLDNVGAVVGLSVLCLVCLSGAGWLFFNPISGGLEAAFWGALFLQVVLLSVAIFCICLIIRYFEKKREARLREEEKMTGIKLL